MQDKSSHLGLLNMSIIQTAFFATAIFPISPLRKLIYGATCIFVSFLGGFK